MKTMTLEEFSILADPMHPISHVTEKEAELVRQAAVARYEKLRQEHSWDEDRHSPSCQCHAQKGGVRAER